MSTYGFGPAVFTWGGFLADLVCVPYANHMLVPVPAGLDPSSIASASDNISDPGGRSRPASPSGRTSRFWSSVARDPGRSAFTPPGSPSPWVHRRCSTSTPIPAAARSRRRSALGAQTQADVPKRLGPFGIAVDASGDPAGLVLALRSTAPDGVCTSTAIYFGEQPTMPLLEMYTKGITFHTGRANAREAIPHVLELAALGALRPELVTTRAVDWTDAADALLENDWTKLAITRDHLNRPGRRASRGGDPRLQDAVDVVFDRQGASQAPPAEEQALGEPRVAPS
jgi:hypothetical protein